MKKFVVMMGLCLGLSLAGCSNKDKPADEKEVSLEIVVKDEVNEKELFNETLTQSGEIETLYDFLENCDELEIVFGDGTYGTYIEAMMGLKQDFDKGPWWLYASENNEVCKANGMCPAIKDLEIHDGDQFVFSYVNEF